MFYLYIKVFLKVTVSDVNSWCVIGGLSVCVESNSALPSFPLLCIPSPSSLCSSLVPSALPPPHLHPSAEKKWFTDEADNAYPRNIQIKPMSTHMANQVNQYKSTSSLIPPIREVEDECWVPGPLMPRGGVGTYLFVQAARQRWWRRVWCCNASVSYHSSTWSRKTGGDLLCVYL